MAQTDALQTSEPPGHPVWTPHKQLLVTSSPRNLVALNNLPREERKGGGEGREETERERVKRVWGEVREQTKTEVNSSKPDLSISLGIFSSFFFLPLLLQPFHSLVDCFSSLSYFWYFPLSPSRSSELFLRVYFFSPLHLIPLHFSLMSLYFLISFFLFTWKFSYLIPIPTFPALSIFLFFLLTVQHLFSSYLGVYFPPLTPYLRLVFLPHSIPTFSFLVGPVCPTSSTLCTSSVSSLCHPYPLNYLVLPKLPGPLYITPVFPTQPSLSLSLPHSDVTWTTLCKTQWLSFCYLLAFSSSSSPSTSYSSYTFLTFFT